MASAVVESILDCRSEGRAGVARTRRVQAFGRSVVRFGRHVNGLMSEERTGCSTCVFLKCKTLCVSYRRLVTLSGKEMVILDLLVRGQEMYGLEMVAASRRRLKRGTVYVTLGRMEDKGYVTSRLEAESPAGGGPRRRLYQATGLGRRVLALWTDMAARVVPEPAR